MQSVKNIKQYGPEQNSSKSILTAKYIVGKIQMYIAIWKLNKKIGQN